MRKRTPAVLAMVLAGASLPFTATADGAEEKLLPLGGYTAYVAAAPVAMRLYEPVLPLPVEPQGELDLAFTQAMTSTGPDQRATASTIWPGAAVGDGFSTVTTAIGLGPHDYPVQANATYPTGNRDASSSMGIGDMTAKADGTTATATARSGPASGSASLGAANAASTSTVQLGSDRITASASAAASDLVIGGVIRIRQVEASTSTSSTATTATAGGSAVVTGVSIGGVEVSVDGDGVHVADHDQPLPGADPNTVLEQFGMTVTGQQQVREVSGATARYSAYALRITIDTKLYKDAAESTGYRRYWYQLIGMLPPEIRDVLTDPRLPQVIDLRPRIVIDVGYLTASTSAVPQYEVALPGVPPVDPLPPDPGVPPVTGGAGPDLPPYRPEPAGPAPQQPPAGQPQPVAYGGDPLEPFGGLPPALVVLALLGAMLAGFGLRTAAAVAGALPGTRDDCRLGARTGVPDLRREAR